MAEAAAEPLAGSRGSGGGVGRPAVQLPWEVCRNGRNFSGLISPTKRRLPRKYGFKVLQTSR